MKGIVFTLLSDYIEEALGMSTLDKLLSSVDLPSGGVFTAGGTYDYQELVVLVTKLSEMTGVPVFDLCKGFGKNMLWQFSKKFPMFFQDTPTAIQFISGIEETIHIEVKKLYPDASLPTFRYEYPSDSSLVMIYRSPRNLCALAEGLIDGTAEYYKTPIHYKQTACSLHGADHCRFELEFGEP